MQEKRNLYKYREIIADKKIKLKVKRTPVHVMRQIGMNAYGVLFLLDG